MAELLLQGRGIQWGCGSVRGGGPVGAATLQPKNPVGIRWRRGASPARSGPDDEDDSSGQSPLQLPQKMCAAGLAALLLMTPQTLPLPPFAPPQVQAAGLLSMPPQTLNNRYYLVRAGYSFFESQGVIHTNPVSKTSVDSGLSDEGMQQTSKAALELRSLGACEGSCWIWPSITQRSYQTAELIAYVNKVNYRNVNIIVVELKIRLAETHSRIVPEYSFLDARGLGAYENRQLSAIAEVYASDLQSPTFRPPKYTDGTPNESVSDVLVRVTQLMSILETQYFGDTVIIVSPDSDNLSVLQSALSGQDIRRHSALAFAPGEVRRFDRNALPLQRPLLSGKFKITQ